MGCIVLKEIFLVCSRWIQDSSLKQAKTIHSLVTCRVTLVTLDCVWIWELLGSYLICIIDCLESAPFIPDPFQFIVHESYFHMTLYGLDYRQHSKITNKENTQVCFTDKDNSVYCSKMIVMGAGCEEGKDCNFDFFSFSWQVVLVNQELVSRGLAEWLQPAEA